MTRDPYQPPGTDPLPETAVPLLAPGGIGRLLYWISFSAFVAILCLAVSALGAASGQLLAVVFWVAMIVLAFPRLKNIGMNPWLSLSMIVPLVNIFVIFCCLIYQENHEPTRKLDKTGKILLMVLILSVFLFAFAF